MGTRTFYLEFSFLFCTFAKEINNNMSTDKTQSQKFREYLKSLPEDVKRTSFFIKYIDRKEGAKYTVGEYFQNNMGYWIGTIDGVFDFDFFEIHDVVGFLPMENVLTAIDSLNLKYVE